MNDTTKPKATILDLDAIMDMKIDEVATIPDFVTPPAGTYILEIKDCKTEKYENKQKEKGSRIRITYAIKETIEVAEGEMPYPNGSLFSETFMGTEQGLEYFKKAAMNILGVTSFEGASVGDVMGGVKDAEFKAKITIRKSKAPDGGTYENLTIRAFTPVVSAD